jgi:hypothetical protein
MSPEWSLALADLERCNRMLVEGDSDQMVRAMEERGKVVGRIALLITGPGQADVEVYQRLLAAVREGDLLRRNLALARENTRVQWEQCNRVTALVRTLRGSTLPHGSTVDCLG